MVLLTLVKWLHFIEKVFHTIENKILLYFFVLKKIIFQKYNQHTFRADHN